MTCRPVRPGLSPSERWCGSTIWWIAARPRARIRPPLISLGPIGAPDIGGAPMRYGCICYSVYNAYGSAPVMTSFAVGAVINLLMLEEVLRSLLMG